MSSDGIENKTTDKIMKKFKRREILIKKSATMSRENTIQKLTTIQ